MNETELTERIASHFRKHADEFGMKGERVQTCSLPNSQDFAPITFLISDSLSAAYLILAKDADQKKQLLKWKKCHPILEECYRAPRILQWIDLNKTDYSGLLLQNIDGIHPDFRKPSLLLEEVIYVMDNLHNDEELAEKLSGMEERRCLADSFIETWVEPFQSRLHVIENSPSCYISAEYLSWMRQEVENLDSAVRASPEFMRFATKPIHGNLGAGEIVVNRDENWFIMNWARFGLGDPAIDYACLLWPLFTDGSLKAPGQNFPIPSHDAGFSRRLSLCLRARSLGEVVNGLAKTAKCENNPEHMESDLLAMQQDHENNMSDYRRRFC